MVVILTSRLISLSIEVCIPPEEVAIATKACGIDIINVRLFVCLSRCPKQQKTKTKDKYENNNEDNDNKDNNNKDKDNRDNNNEDSDKKDHDNGDNNNIDNNNEEKDQKENSIFGRQGRFALL